MQKLSHTELLQRQARLSSRPKLRFCAVLNNIRSLYNVGSMFRTADGAGLEKLWLCGITGIPPHPKISKTALDAEKSVPWGYRRNAVSCLRELKKAGYEIVLLEQTAQSLPHHAYRPQKPVCLVVGNEIEGVQDDLLACADRSIEIEMTGVKNSLNVTVAFGIAAYSIRRNLSPEDCVDAPAATKPDFTP